MLEQLLTTGTPAFAKISDLAQFLAVVFLCAGALYLVYRKTAPNTPSEVEFASTIFILTISIGLLVSIIKQAPLISFGLFGAMSIVRFRAQIKQPKRMIFVFMAAAIGVCCGAGEFLTTIAGTVVLSVVALAFFSPAHARLSARLSAVSNTPLVAEDRRWGLDIVPTVLRDGQRMRTLVVVDENTHEALALVADGSLSGSRVVDELERLIVERGRPSALISDTWPEFGSRTARDWKKERDVDWQWVELSSTLDPEPFLVTFLRLLPDDCFKSGGFANIAEAQVALANWRDGYNGRLLSAREPHAASSASAKRAPSPPLGDPASGTGMAVAVPDPATKPGAALATEAAAPFLRAVQSKRPLV